MAFYFEEILKIVILTGAGISAESGLKTFRDAGGLWEGHDVMEVASPEGWSKNQALVLDFYNQRRRNVLNAKPNIGHTSLVSLEANFNVTIVTQNVDDLHERAGSKSVIHLHGELLKSRSTADPKLIYDCKEDIVSGDTCEKGSQLRPHIVWFGEMPFGMKQIIQALEACDLFVAIGTSGNVYPASSFYHTAKQHQANTVELNLKATGSRYDERFYGPATEVVPGFFSSLL